jgi:hypothetical protein
MATVDFARAIDYGDMRHPDGEIRKLASLDAFHSYDVKRSDWVQLKSGKWARKSQIERARHLGEVELYEPSTISKYGGIILLSAVAGAVLFYIGAQVLAVDVKVKKHPRDWFKKQ